MLSTEEIRALLLDLESDRVERTISTTDKFGQAICAFANDLPNRMYSLLCATKVALGFMSDLVKA